MLVVVVLVSACTTQSQGTPRRAPGASDPTAPTESPSHPSEAPASAPRVEQPLDITKFLQDPCAVLTPAQRDELTVAEGEPSDGAVGKACTWRNPDTMARTDIRMRDKSGGGLDSVYRANRSGQYEFFYELPPIEGFPAVAYDTLDDRKGGLCSLSVGIADELSFAVGVRLSRGNVGKLDPCDTLADIAGMMVRTMKSVS